MQGIINVSNNILVLLRAISLIFHRLIVRCKTMLRVFFLTLIVCTTNIHADDIIDDHDISNVANCWEKWSEGTLDLSSAHSCLKQEYELSDANLNKVYGDMYRYIEENPRTSLGAGVKIDTEQLNLLKESQRAWLKFRDKECELVLSNEDVPNLSNLRSEATWLSCMIIQTNTRTRQLQLYLESEDYYPSPLDRG